MRSYYSQEELEKAIKTLNNSYTLQLTENTVQITVNVVMTLQGRTVTVPAESQIITFENSPEGRERLTSWANENMDKKYLKSILTLWGDHPTVKLDSSTKQTKPQCSCGHDCGCDDSSE